ncbi:iron ABC transporter permease [Alteromonas aestuariivivens]|uniref:Iron ABC transporter permease n=1 Tax=Alteromonas aestuariivivens TaxID=1938339 RepID=A0A3D8M3R2_9ALTE|nr:iron ABC transporter permease [Alteromonas aestuariivivens]RDV24258.1 iron ABC transporter permease [Alteromonas aestuariivivens]
MNQPFRLLPVLAVMNIGLVLMIVANDWFQASDPQVRWHIFTQLQIPLVLTACLVGAALTVSAGTLQVVLRNPLADPGIIGITSGASLVAAFLLLVLPQEFQHASFYFMPVGCFTGAVFSTWIIYRIAQRLRGMTVAVVLAGIAVSTVSGALIGWMYLFSDAQSLRNLTFWLMGSLYQSDWWVIGISGPIMAGAVVYQLLQANKLNSLYAGRTAAAAAGVEPHKLIKRSLLVSAIGVGAAVSVAGSIAFLGLLVPHLLRLSAGHDNRFILPAAALTGSWVLLCVVWITESMQMVTVPVSMLTATIGGPLFLLALYRGQWR